MRVRVGGINTLAAAALTLSAGAAHAVPAAPYSIFGYNVGITDSTTVSYARIIYDAPPTQNMPSDCDANGNDSMRCTAYLAPSGTGSSNISIFLQRPFERQGLFYFEPGFTFATVSYTGTLAEKPKSVEEGGGRKQEARKDPPAVQPLTLAKMSLYGADWQGYLRVGLTPRYLPDLFVSGGLGIQTVYGSVRMFQDKQSVFVAQPEAFAEAEAVFIRIATGYLSVYVQKDQSLASSMGSKLVADHPSGTSLTNLRLGLVAAESGVRLLFPF